MPSPKATLKRPEAVSILLRWVVGWTVAALFAVGAALLAQHLQSSTLRMAQSAMGIFGLTGGISLLLLIKAVSGNVSIKQTLLIPAVWTASCAAVVTPLFYTSGTNLKMMVLSFYCFATGGALGGMVAAFLMPSFFNNRKHTDITSEIIIWSFSFGFAAILSDMVAGKLQSYLPEIIVWLLAFSVIAVTVGSGAAYSLF